MAGRLQLRDAWPLVAAVLAALLAVTALVIAVLVLRDPPMDPVPVPSVSRA